MKSYVCVYRQPLPKDLKWEKTWKEGADKRGLRKYLERYRAGFEQGPACFYDWGDDPAFFAAEEFIGDVNRASWGVCRRNLREKLHIGDFVIFFCAKAVAAESTEAKAWEYYYVGLGTVSESLDRSIIWSADEYKSYRDFFNLLVDPSGAHREFIYDRHDCDWLKRADAPYILFEPSRNLTHFNVASPILVATYRLGGDPWRDNVIEQWQLDDEGVQTIYQEIPRRIGGRKLRTGRTDQGYPHQYQNLSHLGDRELEQKRQRLLQISNDIDPR